MGHQGPDALQELVVSDELLDDVGIDDRTPDSIHEDLLKVADALLALRPLE